MNDATRGGTDEATSGHVAPGYEAVRARFDDALVQRAGWSGAVCVYRDGQPVVDLWGGPRMGADSLVPLWSCSKGAASLVAALAVDRGLLDPDALVSRYWPEFAHGGKGGVTVTQLLSHQAGLVSVDGGASFGELVGKGQLADRLAGQRPQWPPGTAHGYHALTFGVLIGELLQRIVGSSLQEQFETEMREPIDAPMYLGLPESEESRVLRCHPSRYRVAQATQDNPVVRAGLL